MPAYLQGQITRVQAEGTVSVSIVVCVCGALSPRPILAKLEVEYVTSAAVVFLNLYLVPHRLFRTVM